MLKDGKWVKDNRSFVDGVKIDWPQEDSSVKPRVLTLTTLPESKQDVLDSQSQLWTQLVFYTAQPFSEKLSTIALLYEYSLCLSRWRSANIEARLTWSMRRRQDPSKSF